MLLAVPQPTNAQAFLNKVKEKAQQAAQQAANKMGEAMGVPASSNSSSSSNGASDNRASVQTNDTHDAMVSEESTPLSVSKKANQLQREANHVGNWDDALVTPSEAKFPVPLINELPAVPSAAEIANPTEAAQKAYYMAIQKVALKAQMLSNDETCDKAQQELFEKQLKTKMMKIYGLTEREYAIYVGDIQGTEKEQQEVVAKTLGFNPENLVEAFADIENMSEAEQQAYAKEQANKMMSGSADAIDKVYQKYAVEIKKYSNMTAEEASKNMHQIMNLAMAGKEKESEAIGSKMEKDMMAYRKTLSAEDQKKAKEFDNKIQKEIQEAMKTASRSASPLGNMMAAMEENAKKQQQLQEFINKQKEYQEALGKAIPDAAIDNQKDYQFAAAERKKVEDLRAKIMANDDPAVYNPLYAQANEIIHTYRTRAAQAWRADVEKRFNAIKSSLPGIIKLNRQAIADKIIPECMLYRAPLNMVLSACETLENAYSEMPADYPVLYQAEVVRQVKLAEGEQMWWPEFYVAETVSNILAGKTIFKSSKGQVYQFNAGKWVNATNIKTNTKTLAGETKAKSQKWTSSDGKRTVTYVEEGGYFLLPEGDIIQPRAIEKQGNNLVWAEIVEEEDNNGNSVIKIIKYSYKL